MRKCRKQHVVAASWRPDPHPARSAHLARISENQPPPTGSCLPSAAASTPDIRWWGAWWLHPTRSHSGRCTLHLPWSWPFGLEGHWWLCKGLAFAPGAAAVWKERKTITPLPENSPWNMSWPNGPLSVSIEITNVLLIDFFFLDHMQSLKYSEAPSLKHHSKCNCLCPTRQHPVPSHKFHPGNFLGPCALGSVISKSDYTLLL